MCEIFTKNVKIGTNITDSKSNLIKTSKLCKLTLFENYTFKAKRLNLPRIYC